MAFIDDLKDTFSQAGRYTVQKTKELSDIAKLNGKVSESEKKINELYRKMGYEIYCAYREDPLPEVTEQIREIDELHAAIEDCKEQIKAINESKNCPNCGNKINPNMAFCAKCGYKLSPENETQETFCVSCGKPLAKGQQFCPNCGTKAE